MTSSPVLDRDVIYGRPLGMIDPATYLCRTLEGNGSVVLVTGDDGTPEVNDREAVILHATHERHLWKFKAKEIFHLHFQSNNNNES